MSTDWVLSLATLVLTGIGTGMALMLKAWLAERQRMEDGMVADRREYVASLRELLDQCHATMEAHRLASAGELREQREALDMLRQALQDHTLQDNQAAQERREARVEERAAIRALAERVAQCPIRDPVPDPQRAERGG